MGPLVGFFLGAVLMILPHLMLDQDGRVIFCNELGFYFADQFDDQGRWLEGCHNWTCDGVEVFRQMFTSEAEDLGLLPPLPVGCASGNLAPWGACPYGEG